MSGHSHWKTVKRVKEAEDKKRSQIFSKLSRAISIAAREKGSDLMMNSKLRLVIEEAHSHNMPKENIERAIKRGSGELEGAHLESVLFEAYGPGGIAIIIEGITDNKNRTLGEIKQTLNQNSGKLVGEGGVQWMFERKVKTEEPGSLEWIAKQDIEISEKDKEACQRLFEDLDENDAVQEIYSNLKM